MKKLFIIFSLWLLLIVPSICLAGTPATPPLTNVSDDALGALKNMGNNAGYATEGDSADIVVIIAKIIRAAFGLLGIAAVVIIVVGGFEWMTAGGDEGKVKTAKNRIVQAAIGMAIMLAAYGIANFVVQAVSSATTP